MSSRRWLLACWVLAASMSPCYAGPCSHEIDLVPHQLDARLDARAGAGPMARESDAATMSRQPTPESIAAAEAALGDISPEKLATVRAAMTRAREADSAGDKTACDQALADVQRELGR